jgi:hypothetical protein
VTGLSFGTVFFASFEESALADHFRDKYKPGCGGAKAVSQRDVLCQPAGAQEGNKRKTTEIRARDMVLLSGAGENAASSQSRGVADVAAWSAAAAAPASTITDDDIPSRGQPSPFQTRGLFTLSGSIFRRESARQVE